MKNKVVLSIVFFVLIKLVSSQSLGVNWEYNCYAPSFGSAAAADLDKDGFYEIVFTTYTNDGKAHCLNSENGSVSWVYDIGGCGDVAPLIYDVDNDDTLDVIINGSCNPTIFCINGYTGELKWSVASGGGDSPPTAADMDGDSTPEILFCNFDGELRILNGEDGSIDKVIQVDPFSNPIQTEPTLLDLNQDGDLEIIMANHFNIDGLWIWAYDYATEDTLWTNYMADTSVYNAYHGGAVADVDGDSLLEYVIGSNNGKVRALNAEDGSILWSRDVPVSIMSAISIADLNNDGDLEVVFVNNDYITFDERIYVVEGATGVDEWTYSLVFPSFRGCSIGDINNNGILDLVSGHYMGGVIAVEPYTGLIWEHNLMQYFNPGLPYFVVDHGALIADFDKDDTMDVFIAGGYGTYTPDAQNCGKAFSLKAGLGDCPEWLMFRQDEKRSGYLSNQEVAQSCSDVLEIPTENLISIDVQLYPNPSDVEVTIETIGLTKLEICDIGGRVLEIHNPSNDLYKLDVSHLNAGSYYVRIYTTESMITEKMIIY